MIEKDWNNLTTTPPNDLVEVMDEEGNKAFAYPTYFPFDVVKKDGDERKPFGFRGTVVFHENNEMKWDGGWMVDVGMEINKVKSIKYWRPVNEN